MINILSLIMCYKSVLLDFCDCLDMMIIQVLYNYIIVVMSK